MKKLLSLGLVLLMVVSIFAGCTNQKAATASEGSNDTIKVGVYIAVTGPLAGFGSLEGEGYKFAHELRPEVLGKKVEMITVDTKSDKVEGATAITRLIEKEKAAIILGSSGSSISIAGGAVAKEAGIPVIAGSATNPLVTQGNPWYFRMCFIDTFQGEAMAKYAYDSGMKKIGVLRELNNDFCVGLASFFTKNFIKLTGDENSVVTVDFNNGDQDFSAQLTMLVQGKPDALFIPCPSNYGDVALIAKQLHQLGYTVPILGSDGYEAQELIDLGGKDVDDIYYTTYFDTGADLTPVTAEFLKAYRAKYNQDPAAATVLCYDSYNLALDAIEAAGSTDPEAIRKALKDMDKWPGAGGYVTFDENNNPNKPAVIKKIKDGKFVYVDIVTLDK